MWLELYVVVTSILYGLASLSWLINCFLLPYIKNTREDTVWQESDVQVRVLTVDNESTVKKTWDAARNHFSNIAIISETDMESIDCDVHVVPESFDSKAINKGRALEWARKNVDFDGEYVLYLDEDTIIEDFDGIPDSDIVQFREMPNRTGSLISYLTEVYRTGYQYEQVSFNFYKYPIYVWGGAIAVRQSLENKVTWDYESITEDTRFAWEAVRENDGISYNLVNQEFFGQAPTTIWSLFEQRRRWVTGTVRDSKILPLKYKLLVYSRLLIWVFAPIVFLNGLLVVAFPSPVYSSTWFVTLLIVEILLIHLTTLIGVVRYQKQSKYFLVFAIFLSVILSIVNSIGALQGLIRPSSSFTVTEKEETEE
jgi:cellulose synthase/poly-beta-1,6-N-acetylglucosamine synthase-like glycosyltransferase